MGESSGQRQVNAAALHLIYVLVQAVFVLLWAAPNYFLERFVAGLHPVGSAGFALRCVQVLFAVLTLAPLCVGLLRDLRVAAASGRGSFAETTGAGVGRDYASRRALAMPRQALRDSASPFALRGQDALYFHLSRLFGFLLVFGCAAFVFGLIAALFLLPRPAAVYDVLGMAAGAVVVALLADAGLSHVLSAYYSPDRGRLLFEYLIRLSFLSSFLPGPRRGEADAEAAGSSDGWRGAA